MWKALTQTKKHKSGPRVDGSEENRVSLRAGAWAVAQKQSPVSQQPAEEREGGKEGRRGRSLVGVAGVLEGKSGVKPQLEVHS